MSANNKNYLLNLLTESHAALQEVVTAVDPEILVYTDADVGMTWRIRDIIGHVTTWDDEVAKSLRAYRAGNVYLIPDYDGNEDIFNQQAVKAQRALTTEQIFADWEKGHAEFETAVAAIPDDQFPGDMLYPWGEEQGTITDLVKYMTDHAFEHRDEILKAIK